MSTEGFEPPPPAPPPPGPAQPSSGLRLLGVAQCAVGVFGLASAPLTVITRVMAQDPGGRGSDELLWEGALGAWTYFSLGIGSLLAGLLIAAGIGVLRGKPWGRKLTLAHALGALGLVLLGQIVAATLLYPALWQGASGGTPAERGGAMAGVVGALFGALVGSILPALELWVMTRPSVKECFTR